MVSTKGMVDTMVEGPSGGGTAPESDAVETADLVPIGVVGRSHDGVPTLLANMTNGDGLQPSEPRRPAGLEARPGVIEIDLPCGSRVRVDAAVDARALVRVLSALKRQP
jgi:transposase